jgi:hypothetical protein
MKLIGLLIFLSVEIIFSIGFGFSAEVNFLIEMNEFESSTLITTTTTINTIDTMSINIESSDLTTSMQTAKRPLKRYKRKVRK